MLHDFSPKPLLEISELNVRFRTPRGDFHAVRDVGFTLGRERLAIVGESGSGKSTLARALLGLLPGTASVSARSARFHGRRGSIDLLDDDPRTRQKIRGGKIGMVVQDPRQGLNPVRTIGWQIAEMVGLHERLSRRDRRERVLSLLDDVHIKDPVRVAGLYPHQVSGGMGQRAMIAMMLAAEPEVLVADEATSALDVSVQQRILDLLDEQIARRAMGLILISHDIDLVSRHADRTLVMFGGRVLETLAGDGGLAAASHPYTRGLLACRPTPGNVGRALPTLERDPQWLS